MLETPELRAAKCLKKYHHSGVEATRALKKALTFELQKLTKRLRKARETQEEEDATRRIEAEFQGAKVLETDVLAIYYLQHTITKSHKQLAEVLHLEESEVAPHRDWDDRVKNVVARLYGSKTFKDTISDAVHQLEVIAGLSKTETKKKKKTRVSKVIASREDDEPLPASTSTGVEKPFAVFAAETSDEPQYESDDSAASNVSSSSAARPRTVVDVTSKSSAFLPSLQSGYLPALDGSDDEGQLKGLFPAQKKERKNRRGQRARRKILEAKHGNKANHIIKERQEAQKDYEERVARRAAKEAEKTGANAIAIEEAEKNRRERREALLRPIHGSWAVAKAQKEKVRAAKPQGTKISFD